MALSMAGCGTTAKETLKVYNWGAYIDKSTIRDFEKEYGVKVVYDTFEQNEDLYIKVAKSDVSYDVVCPSDYMIDRLIQEGYLAKLEKEKLTNFNQVAHEYLSPAYDENNVYSVPYFVGTLGILYNKTLIKDAPTSWADLWDEDYKGEILMWNSMRDTLGVAMKLLGYSLNTEKDSELQAVKEKLIEQRPLVQAYAGDEMKDKMIAGEAALAVMYSGDSVEACAENKDLAYVIPKEGSNKWVDGWVILENSPVKDLAHRFIDFMCRPEIAARNMEEVGYTSPIEAAWDNFDDDYIMFPTDEELARCETYLYSPAAVTKYTDIWVEFRSK
jgi:spermidine/putrescine transport system substrate-binding protein